MRERRHLDRTARQVVTLGKVSIVAAGVGGPDACPPQRLDLTGLAPRYGTRSAVPPPHSSVEVARGLLSQGFPSLSSQGFGGVFFKAGPVKMTVFHPSAHDWAAAFCPKEQTNVDACCSMLGFSVHTHPGPPFPAWPSADAGGTHAHGSATRGPLSSSLRGEAAERGLQIQRQELSGLEIEASFWV